MNYYKSLDTFFSKIEKKFKLKVKIALHPKNYLSKKYFLEDHLPSVIPQS